MQRTRVCKGPGNNRASSCEIISNGRHLRVSRKSVSPKALYQRMPQISRSASTVQYGASTSMYQDTLAQQRIVLPNNAVRKQQVNATSTTSTQLQSRTNQTTSSPLEVWRRGRLGFGFSAGGLLYPYFLGIAYELQALGILLPDTPVAGASAGSLIAACCKSGLSEEALMTACLDLSSECRRLGKFGIQ